MNPATRNLYRAANPTFRLDGTPQVTIPSQVLSLGPENKREYLIGQFHRCSLPPGGLIHAVVNRLWGRSCRIGCRNSLAFMYTPTHGSPFHNAIEQFNVHDVGDGLMSDATANLNMSRGGRPIKPSQKYQDKDWIKIQGKASIKVHELREKSKTDLSAQLQDFKFLIRSDSD
ncbi:hypothetical protein F2Q69_00017642 [Brassica cretica]|uniref:Uncharacterized protein n=1 Tax=Brassica cretica TaxID=69181 RepID=A0A8S9QIX2_BRACR|nr:hypothetical protein F2Q69_00017642 [Brassica cretica]